MDDGATILALIGGFFIFIVIGWLVLMLLIIIPTWKICTRAGYSGAVALFHLLPFIGSLIVLAILGLGTWPNGEARRPGA
jgi:hypothetical protein